MVDHLADRSEFHLLYAVSARGLTGFLQALFEYQSLLVELTGLEVANCSMYDAATALGEAATLADRVRDATGHRVLVPDLLLEGRRSTLENYVAGTDLVVEAYPTDDANVDVGGLDELVDDDIVMLYAENPTVRGTIEERLEAVGDLAEETDALFVLGPIRSRSRCFSDPQTSVRTSSSVTRASSVSRRVTAWARSVRHERRVPPAGPRPAGRRERGRDRPAGVHAHAPDQRTTHSTRAGDE